MCPQDEQKISERDPPEPEAARRGAAATRRSVRSFCGSGSPRGELFEADDGAIFVDLPEVPLDGRLKNTRGLRFHDMAQDMPEPCIVDLWAGDNVRTARMSLPLSGQLPSDSRGRIF